MSGEIQLRITERQHERLTRLGGLTRRSPAVLVAELVEGAVAFDNVERLERRIAATAKALRAKPRLSTRVRSAMRGVVAGFPEEGVPVAIDRSIARATVDLCRKSNIDMDTICMKALMNWGAAQ